MKLLKDNLGFLCEIAYNLLALTSSESNGSQACAQGGKPSSSLSDLTNALAVFSSTTGSVIDLNQRNTTRLVGDIDTAEQSMSLLINSIDQLLSDQSLREKLQNNITTRMGSLPEAEMKHYSSNLLGQFTAKYPMDVIGKKIDELKKEVADAESSVQQHQHVIHEATAKIKARRNELEYVREKISKLSHQTSSANDILSVIGYASFIIPWTMSFKAAVCTMSAVAGTSKLISSLILEDKNKKVKSALAEMNSIQRTVAVENRLKDSTRAVIDSVHARQEYNQALILFEAGQASNYLRLVECQEEVQKLESKNQELEAEISRREKRKENNKSTNKFMYDHNELSREKQLAKDYEEDKTCQADVAQLKEGIARNKQAIANQLPEINNPVAMQVYKRIHDIKAAAEREWGFILNDKQAETAKAIADEYAERLTTHSPLYHHAMYAKTTYSNFLQIQTLLKNISPETAQYQTMALSSLFGTYDTFCTLSTGIQTYQNAYADAKLSLEEANKKLVEKIDITSEKIGEERTKLLMQAGGTIGLIIKPLINNILCAMQLYAVLKGDYDPNPMITHLNSIHQSLNRSFADIYKVNVAILGQLGVVQHSILNEINSSTQLIRKEIEMIHQTVTAGFNAVNHNLLQLHQNMQQLRLYVAEEVDRQIIHDINNKLNVWYGRTLNYSEFKDSEKLTPTEFQTIVSDITSSLIGHENEDLPGWVVTVPYSGYGLKTKGLKRQLSHLQNHPSWQTTCLIGELGVDGSRPIPSYEMLMLASHLLSLLVDASIKKDLRSTAKEAMFKTGSIQFNISMTLSMLERLIKFIQTLREDVDVWKKQVKAVREAKNKHHELEQSIELAHQDSINCNYANTIQSYIGQFRFFETVEYRRKLEEHCPSNVDLKYFYPKAVHIDRVDSNDISEFGLSIFSLLSDVTKKDEPLQFFKAGQFHNNNWAATYSVNYSGAMVNRNYFDVNFNTASALEGVPGINVIAEIFRKGLSVVKHPACESKQLIPYQGELPCYGLTVMYQGMRPVAGYLVKPINHISIRLNGIEIKKLSFGAKAGDEREQIFRSVLSDIQYYKIHELYPDERFYTLDNYQKFVEKYQQEFSLFRAGYQGYVDHHSNLLKVRKDQVTKISDRIRQLKIDTRISNENERARQINEAQSKLHELLNKKFCCVAYASKDPIPMMTFHQASNATNLLYEALKNDLGCFYGEWAIQENKPYGSKDNPALVIQWYFVDKQGAKHLYSTELRVTISKEMKLFHSKPVIKNNQVEFVFDWQDFILRAYIGSEDKNSNVGILSKGTIYANDLVDSCLIPQELSFVGLRLLSWFYDYPIKMSSDYDSDLQLLLFDMAKGRFGHLEEITRKLDSGESEALNLLTKRGWRFKGDPVTIDAKTELMIKEKIIANELRLKQQLEQAKNSSTLSDLKTAYELQKTVLTRMAGLFTEGASSPQVAEELAANEEVNPQALRVMTSKDPQPYKSLLVQHLNLSFFHQKSAVHQVKSLIHFETHQIGTSFYHKNGLFTYFAQFYEGFTAHTLQQKLSDFFIAPQNQGKEWVRQFNESPNNLNKGELTLTFIKAICQALYLTMNSLPTSAKHDYQVHVVFSCSGAVEHYVFGKENNTGDPLPKHPSGVGFAPYTAEKLLHMACDKNWVWEIERKDSVPMSSFQQS